jgi:hypothetical protein
VVVGTRFVVEVTPVKKTQAAVAAGSFVVGVMVSSGVVTYADYHRLEAGQGIVDETGTLPRRVAAADVERRRRTAAERERDMETRIAALGIEKDRLGSDLAALQRGEPPAPKAPLTPEDRRGRTRRLAQVLVQSFYGRHSSTDLGSIPLDEKDLERVRKGETVTVEREVEARLEVDGKAVAEVLELANDLGMNFFDPASFCSKPEMAEELMMAVLEARAQSASGLRPAVEAAIRSAYGALPGSWESKTEERLAEARALQGALAQLGGTLSADQMRDLYGTARTILTPPEYLILTHADAKYKAEWVDRVAKAMDLDAASRPALDAAVDEMIAMLAKVPGIFGSDTKEGFEYSIRAREAGAELARQLAARFPDKKARIDYALDPR